MTESAIASGVTAIAEQVREARARSAPIRIAAGGHWLDAGRPHLDARRLELSELSGIVSYEPGDLTLTARAATSLAEIESVTAAKGQWLTLDPYGSSAGTIGATVATGSWGPLASAYGTPRDHVLGCEFVTGVGDVVRAGGRVVKNVAGFDLVRLVTGSWGTLGALTEMTVRLRARPEEDLTLFARVAGSNVEAMATAAWRWTRESEYRPLAAELLSPSLARAIGGDGDAQLLVRLGGNAAFVRAARDSVASVGEVRETSVDAWQRLRTQEPPGAIVFRASTLPSRIGILFAQIAPLAEELGGFAHATLSRGVVRCVIPASHDHVAFTALSASLVALGSTATIVGERMPASLWSVVSRELDSAALAGRVRQAFDPDRVMNRSVQET
ncbi:MAG: FAD-binding protein [Gemmatimonadota bacterium]|nr:FAD-binding protein [Gemmatimonadota bacterium]